MRFLWKKLQCSPQNSRKSASAMVLRERLMLRTSVLYSTMPDLPGRHVGAAGHESICWVLMISDYKKINGFQGSARNASLRGMAAVAPAQKWYSVVLFLAASWKKHYREPKHSTSCWSVSTYKGAGCIGRKVGWSSRSRMHQKYRRSKSILYLFRGTLSPLLPDQWSSW